MTCGAHCREKPPGEGALDSEDEAERKRQLRLPEENLLYFIEKKSPSLEPWQRELLRIVRNIGQYFYAQKQTKVMNEGCATFVQYYIVNKLHEQGRLNEGAMLEILHSHSNVVLQRAYDDAHYGGVNPYALGFSMMGDIVRICTEPTDEDRDWFPAIAGRDDWREVLNDAWANYRDESFIRQFLSPHLMRKMRMFALADDTEDNYVTVTDIHDERGYEKVRETLARGYDLALTEPEIQIVDVDLRGDRHLHLRHTIENGVPLAERSRDAVLAHLRRLWGYGVTLTGVDRTTGATQYTTSAVAN